MENAGLQQKTQKPRNQNIEIGTEIGTKNRKRQKKLLVQRIKDYKRQKLLLYMKYEISLNLCKVSKWGLNQADKGVIITTQKSLFKLN